MEQYIRDRYISKINEYGYSVIEVDDMHIPAVVCHDRSLVVMSRQNCSIFHIAHELAHVAKSHTGRLTAFGGCDNRNSNEHEANWIAIVELVNFHINNEWPLNICDVIEWYGVPYFLEHMVQDAMLAHT